MGSPSTRSRCPRVISAAPTPYSTAMVGKWHLSSIDTGGHLHPRLQGFDHYWGGALELHDRGLGEPAAARLSQVREGRRRRESRWSSATRRSTRPTTPSTSRRPCRSRGSSPCRSTRAHSPYDPPPARLYTQNTVTNNDPVVDRWRAIVEATDTELGRVLAGLGPVLRDRTMVVVFGDNGTPKLASTPPFSNVNAKQECLRGRRGRADGRGGSARGRARPRDRAPRPRARPVCDGGRRGRRRPGLAGDPRRRLALPAADDRGLGRRPGARGCSTASASTPTASPAPSWKTSGPCATRGGSWW